ncbi:hypothetical protein I308_105724 [Cryptococcus tetragattii IND107]|uniref:Major facilitator superfamily (MFS) profile domain-containing protein n=1 Tax=Cryptococcus tetragattii IND107 TaxID=1296105 RepID=A0ABR3BNB9_9TREE
MSRTASNIDKEKASSEFVENENEIEIIEDTRALSDKPSGFGGHLIDENLVKVEGEDKVTPYLCFLISASAIAGGSALSSSQQEIITAGTTIGAIFGSAILGGRGDRLGRKAAILIADVFFTVDTVLTAASYSVPQMIVGRIVLGVGVGGAAAIAPLFITETGPTAVRGRCIGVNAFFIPFGQVVSEAIGAGVQDMKNGWRLLFALGATPSLFQLILFHYLPESPRILILRGQTDRARHVFGRIYPKATPEMIHYKVRVAEEYVTATTALQSGTTYWQRTKTLIAKGS